ncbi:hypothetical protein F0562_013272 [Nyssa sinensis]|uniref:Uncharacterized protein n=1 Tax=Nyssa sinensis TaxID=561372 RepID=A0A5J4ZZ59_9ASTE|nr:hypothetical protein F0562_013272 [Nyssa sinensis]
MAKGGEYDGLLAVTVDPINGSSQSIDHVFALNVRLALEKTIAVTGLTPPFTCSIKVAIGSGPDTGSLGACRGINDPVLASVELLATTGHSRSPNSEGAVVYDIESGCMGEG